VATRALAAVGTEEAAACVAEATRSADPAVRAAGAAGLPLLMARERIRPPRGWEIVKPLVSDDDAAVRKEAVRSVAMFDWDHASGVLGAMEKDADPEVARFARVTLEGLRQYRNFNPDRPY
jgi:hypothetical protein